MDNPSKSNKAKLECGQCIHYKQDEIFSIYGICELESPDEEGMVHLFEFSDTACDDFTFIS